MFLSEDNDTYKKHRPTFVDVILPIPLPKPLTYKLPEKYLPGLVQGHRVLVPLGKRKILTGLVYRIHQHPPTYPTKSILNSLEHTPIVNAKQLSFFSWLANYYLCTVGEVMSAALPSGLRPHGEYQIKLNPAHDIATPPLSKDAVLLINTLTKHTKLTYKEVADLVNHKNIHTLVQSLYEQQIISYDIHIIGQYIPKGIWMVCLHTKYIANTIAWTQLLATLSRKKKQLEVIERYVAKMPSPSSTYLVSKKVLIDEGASKSALQTLIDKNILVETQTLSHKIKLPEVSGTSLTTLHQTQYQVYLDIKHQWNTHDTVLLHGVTASGKTEIYTHLIHSILQEKGQVLYLLPEIALTAQMVNRLQKTFGHRLRVYHSRHTNNQRIATWYQVHHTQCTLILGTRSALFLPFHKLRLIIVDEEHDSSYKQSEAAPRYHARDAALVLAQQHKAKVLLGSATPSIESYYHARSGKYGLVTLSERFNHNKLPAIHLVNLTIAKKKKTLHAHFTKSLINALQEVLTRKKQAIIFQNRRGYSPYVLCADCAWVPQCPRCAVSLTYHQGKNQLCCHYCSYRTVPFSACQACGSHQLNHIGFGTEQLEETLQWLFPKYVIKRMDLDTTRSKHSYTQLITALEQKKVDILIGTQMLSKGFDFGEVALVGILDIDRQLHFPDFRANERCFQLLTQVSGRAGRREQQGLVIIQTHHPKHPILQDAVKYDYNNMYVRELKERRQFRYPPYVRIINIRLKHKQKNIVYAAANAMAQDLRKVLRANVLGPQPPIVDKQKQKYLIDIWVKIVKENTEELQKIKHTIVQVRTHTLRDRHWKKLNIVLDVDPA